MVKRVTWSIKAVSVFNKILDFYMQRNGSKTYSAKINKEIKAIINLVKTHPFLGRSTDINHLRVVIRGDYKIFYKLGKDEIIILMVWDCRQNPENLEL